MLRKLKRRENGDTIVEVLISLAILALVLGGAYYTAGQSYKNDRDSQEHTEALTVAQTQLEDLRTYGDGFNPSTDACLETLNDKIGAVTANECYVDSATNAISTQSCPTTAPYCYDVKITEPSKIQPVTINVDQPTPASSVTVNTYEINVIWEPLGESCNYTTLADCDSVTLYYRVDNS